MKQTNLIINAIFWFSALITWSGIGPSRVYAQDKLPNECWNANKAIPANCEGEVSTGLFPFCPSKNLYEQVKDMMPSQAARFGCEADVEGRLVKVLSCTYTSCKYSLYYGYDEWKTMWSQAGIVRK